MKYLIALIIFLVVCSGFYNSWFVTRRMDILKDPSLQPKGDLPVRQLPSTHT